MNAIFALSCTAAVLYLIFVSPESALSAMLGGAEKAALLCFSLLPVYAVWTGVFCIAERAKINEKLASKLKRPVKKLFGKVSDKAAEYISLNLTANLLGMSGVATPLGIAACERLEKERANYASCMLFVLAATSLQILPTSVISLMSKYGSKSPSSIILPSFLSTALSTLLGIVGVKIFVKNGKRPHANPTRKTQYNAIKKTQKTKNYGTRKSGARL